MTILRAQKPDGTFGEVQMDAGGNLLVNDGGRRTRVVSGRSAGCSLEAFINTGNETADVDNYMGVLFYNVPIVTTCSNLRLVYGNFVGSAANTDPVTIRASVEIEGALYPIYFGGRRETIVEGSVIESDPLGLSVEAGTMMKVRTYYNLGSAGTQLPMSDLYIHGYDSACFADADTRQDANGWKDALLTVLDSVDFTSWGDYVVDARTFAPVAVLGDVDPGQRSVAILGDSIAAGLGDNNLTLNGFAARALSEAGIPFVNIGLTGEESDALVRDPRRLRLMSNCTHAIVAYGRDDVTNGRSLQTIKERLLNLWTALSERGLRVHACTVTPSVDPENTALAYLSVEHQVPASHADVLDALNDWIRTCPAPLSSVFDTAAEISARNEDGQPVWKVWDNPAVTMPYSGGHVADGYTLVRIEDVTEFPHTGLGDIPAWPSPFPPGGLVKFAGQYQRLDSVQYDQGDFQLAVHAVEEGFPATGLVYFYDTCTLDGLHPTPTGHIAMSNAVDTDQLT
jgi:lysophospholipase L1-like esterase